MRLDRLSVRNIEYLWSTMVADGVLASVQHCKRTLDAAISNAVEQGLIARDPVSQATTPRYSPSAIEPYSLDEMADLLRRDGRDPQWRAMDTCARPGPASR